MTQYELIQPKTKSHEQYVIEQLEKGKERVVVIEFENSFVERDSMFKEGLVKRFPRIVGRLKDFSLKGKASSESGYDIEFHSLLFFYNENNPAQLLAQAEKWSESHYGSLYDIDTPLRFAGNCKYIGIELKDIKNIQITRRYHYPKKLSAPTGNDISIQTHEI